MFNILWIGFQLFDDFSTNISRLSRLNSKILFMNGLCISILGLISLFLGKMLNNGGAPHTVFFQLIATYIITYICLSIILTGLGSLSYRINILQFLGLYLLMDFPLIGILPLYMIGITFSATTFVTQIFIGIVGIISIAFKYRLFMNYFKISFSQALVINFIPFILLLLLMISSTISLFNNIVSLL